MSRYMIVQSDQNQDYFPDNTPYNFKIKLPEPVMLQGDWTVALTEITMREDRGNKDTCILYIYTNICSESFINGVNVPLLRRVVSINKGNFTFAPCYYIPVIKSELSEIEFTLENEQGHLAKHLKNPVSLTLHLASA